MRQREGWSWWLIGAGVARVWFATCFMIGWEELYGKGTFFDDSRLHSIEQANHHAVNQTPIQQYEVIEQN